MRIRGRRIKNSWIYLTLAFIFIILVFFTLFNSKQIFFQPVATISSSYMINPPLIIRELGYDSIVDPDLDFVETPGEPVIPFKTLRFVIPLGQKIDKVEIVAGERKELAGIYLIRPGQEAYPFSDLSNNVEPNPLVIEGRFFNEMGNLLGGYEGNFTPPNVTIYNSSTKFPGITYSIESTQEKYGYTLLIIKLFPFQYSPLSGKLFYSSSFDIQIYTSTSMSSKDADTLDVKSSNMRNLKKDFDRIQDFVDNPSSISWDNTKVSLTSGEQSEYIIITSRSLETEFQKLIDWKISRGLSARMFFVEDILSNSDYSCSGLFGDGCGEVGENMLDDPQARIRNFIKHAYKDLGTDYVLLGGDISIIPKRGVYIWTGGWFTNFSVPSDLYYAGLNGSWNNDRDELFGEPRQDSGPEGSCAPILWRNGTRGDEFDLLAEVYVGRAPVETIEETKNFVSKTIRYENDTLNNKTYLNRALIAAERLDRVTDSSESMELLSKNLSQFAIEKVYEVYWEDIKHPNATHAGGSTSEVQLLLEPTSAIINRGVSLIAHQGHAGAFTVMRFDPREVLGWNDSEYSLYIREKYPLNNTIYPLIYSTGCDSAAFDEDVKVWNNSLRNNMLIDSIGESFVISQYGAFAYIGNTRFGFYKVESTEGVSEKFQRSFFDQINSGVNNLGRALQKSREIHVGKFNSGYTNRWVYLNLVLLGDPETPIKYEFEQPKIRFDTPDYRTKVNFSLLINATILSGDKEGSTFSNFSVEYGYGLYPKEWSNLGVRLFEAGTIKSSEQIAEIDTSYLQDGPVKFRISANTLDNKSSDASVILFADNIEISYPFIWGENSIYFNGIANISNFSNFEFYYQKIKNGNGWILVTNSTSPAIRGNLGSISVSDLVQGEYQVKLRVYSSNGIVNEENSSFVFDPKYLPGWPQYSDQYFLSYSVGIGQLSPVLGKEVVAGESGQGADVIKVHAWYSNGSYLPGWPVLFDGISRSSGYSSSPLLTDANSDGIDEVFISVAGKIYGIYANGTIMNGWPKYGGGFRTLSLININGKKALVSVPCGDGVYVYYLNGSLVSGWPKSISEAGSSPWMQTPSIGDFDGDGNEDIIIVSPYWRKIYAFHSNGSVFSNWPISAPLCAKDIYPVLADINVDGKTELIFGTGNGFFSGGGYDSSYKCNRGEIYAYTSDGSLVSGWPLSPFDYRDYQEYGGMSTGISVANLDQDPELELVVVGSSTCAFNLTAGTRTYCVYYSGAGIFDRGDFRFDNFSIIPNGNLSKVFNGYGAGINFLGSPAVIGDIDGDGVQEILFSIDGSFYKSLIPFINDTGNKLFAFHINGSLVRGWPKELPQLLGADSSGRVKLSSPVITDLDEDGMMDVVFGDEKHLIVWNLSVPFESESELSSMGPVNMLSESEIIGRSDWPTAFGSYSYTSFFSSYLECTDSGDCNDSRICTIDSCVLNKCLYDFSSCAQCSKNSDCNDLRDCTIDLCLEGQCIYDESPCSQTPPSGDGGSSSSNRGSTLCIPSWNCNWSECINGFQTYECIDSNNCNNLSSRPSETPLACQDGWIPETPDSTDRVDNSRLVYLYFLIGILFILVIIYFLIRFFNPIKNFLIKRDITDLRSKGYRDDIITQILIEKGISSDKIKKLL